MGVAEEASTHLRPLDLRRDVMTFKIYGRNSIGVTDSNISVDISLKSKVELFD